ncbi:hypothetical protein EYZ11_013295 [Aspergillus tanneri]|uniref:Uncharacterized protein n=1 Tax=Aspergillus tanneri TaxID=1220188 RepID=A0A4S3J083_9EURO|nr:hypothetical protein EYZ11_013295 [Aspergillus tanneri]
MPRHKRSVIEPVPTVTNIALAVKQSLHAQLHAQYPLLPPLLLRPLSCLLLIYGPKKHLLLFLGLAAVVLPLKGSSTARVAAALNEYRLSNPVPQWVVPPANPVEDDPDEPQDDPDNDPVTIRGLHGPLPLATDLRYII